MIVRQHSYGKRVLTSTIDEKDGGKASEISGASHSHPISSVPFELRSFLLRKQQNTGPKQTVRPFNGFISKSQTNKESFDSNKSSNNLLTNDRLNSFPYIFKQIFISTKSPIEAINSFDKQTNVSHKKGVERGGSYPTALHQEQYFDIQVRPTDITVPVMPIKIHKQTNLPSDQYPEDFPKF